MAKESSKSMRRRWEEDKNGFFPWKEVFKGSILDVGAGNDPLPVKGVAAFDKESGNAEKISEYFDANFFDCVHLSHCMEHLSNPVDALRQIIKITKPDGYIVFTVPDVGAYERFKYPSKNNPDHKSSWSMIYEGSAFPIHIHIPTWLEQFKDSVKVLMARYVERNFDWKKPDSVDQTWIEKDGCEIWNEVVLLKL